MTSSCDTIDTVEYILTHSGEKTPFGVRTVKYIEYEYVDTQISTEEAIELALERLRDILDAEDGELLSKEFSASLSDDKYILDCTVVSMKNIAKQVEIETEG